jgi:signal transduction histidine kinase
VRLEVADDGVGGGSDGNGLAGMRERIAVLGGQERRGPDSLRRRTAAGTTVQVTVPAAGAARSVA